MRTACRDIIVIGASAGGLEPLCAVVSSLPADLPAAIFVVVHVPAWRDSALPAILSRCSPLPAFHPPSGQPVEHGRIYVTPPDRHLLVRPDNRVEVWRAPRENNFRPAVNALFRSAAVAYGERVTGVILSGALEDGATGLGWIKRMGGTVVIQDPADAEFRDMPNAALSHVSADYVASSTDIGEKLSDLANGNRREDKETQEEGRNR